MAASNTKEYILGTGDDERARLEIQHRVWADAAVGAWKRGGVAPGAHVLDLGCGPGHASFEIAQLVTGAGLVMAVDESENFVSYLNGQAKSRHLPQLKSAIADAQDLSQSIPAAQFDAVYCRWVLCWLKDPFKAIAGIAHALKPGGKVIIHDYFNWKIMTTGPRSVAVEKMVAAALESFEDRDGDVDVAARIPKMLRDSGFRMSHFDVHQRVARGGGIDSTIAWPLTWWRSYGPKLVSMGKLSAADYEQAERDMAVVEKDPDRFFYCPPLFEFIAEKIL